MLFALNDGLCTDVGLFVQVKTTFLYFDLAGFCSFLYGTVASDVARLIDDLLEKASTWLCFVLLLLLLLLLLLVSAKCQEKQKLIGSIYFN